MLRRKQFMLYCTALFLFVLSFLWGIALIEITSWDRESPTVEMPDAND